MLQLIVMLFAMTSGRAEAHPADVCPTSLSRIFRVGQMIAKPMHDRAFREIRQNVFPGFSLAGQPHLEPLHATSGRDWPQRDQLVAGRLAYHEMSDGTSEVVEADLQDPLRAIANYGQLAGWPGAINFPGDYDPLGLLRATRNLSAAAGVGLPLAYLGLEGAPFPMMRAVVAVSSFFLLNFASATHLFIRAADTTNRDLGKAHADLHSNPAPGAWVYTGINLPYYFAEGYVAMMPLDAVTYVDSNGKPQTFFLVQPTPFRNYVEHDDSQK